MEYDVVVIGAGVTGCATAMELSRYRLRVAVLEAGEDVCVGTSKANSAIVHAGFDALPGSLMARFNVAGSRAMEGLCRRLEIPYKRIGALVLCFSEDDRPRLEALRERGEKNGVEGLRIVEGEELRAMEPAVSPKAVAALYAPGSAVVCPFELTIAMAENAAANGAEFFFDTPAETVKKVGECWEITTPRGIFAAPVVVNAAGVYGTELHNRVSPRKLATIPRKGEYCLMDKKEGGLVAHTLFQLPGKMGKGVLVTPTVHGNLLVGPTAQDVDDPASVNTTAEGLAAVLAAAGKSVSALPANRVITSFAGLRAHIDREEHDFILGEAEGAPGFLDAIGIESPGLSAAPAIGAFLAAMAAERLQAHEKEGYIAHRAAIPHPAEMPLAERAVFVKNNPAYGSIVCRCEGVTEGEIEESVRRIPGARSLDGVKRRTRAGMGRCQAGFCSLRVLEILSRELGIPQEELTKCGGASRPILGHTREDGGEK